MGDLRTAVAKQATFINNHSDLAYDSTIRTSLGHETFKSVDQKARALFYIFITYEINKMI